MYSIFDDLKLVGKFDDLLESPLTNLPVFDISSRLLCYTSSSTSECDGVVDEGDIQFKMDDMEALGVSKIAKSIATKAAKGVGAVGGYGFSAIHQYLAGDKTSEPSPNGISNDPRYGSVTIVLLGRNSKPTSICKFKPHKHPISAVCISNSGTILMTASSVGKTVCAWSLMNCFAKPNPQLPVCLTRFNRGLTSATVTNVSISNDDKWLTVATSVGTIHLYQITSDATNSACIKINSRNVIQMARSMFPSTGTSLSPRNNLKVSSSIENEASDLGYDDVYIDALQNVPMGMVLQSIKLDRNLTPEPLNFNGKTDKLSVPVLCWNPFGKLSLSVVKMTEVRTMSDSGPKTKKVFTLTTGIEWNVCRHTHWEETFCAMAPVSTKQKIDIEKVWPSLIEIATSNARSTPIWTDQQIELQSYKLKGNKVVGLESLEIPKMPQAHGYLHLIRQTLDPNEALTESFSRCENGYELIVSGNLIPDEQNLNLHLGGTPNIPLSSLNSKPNTITP